MSNSYARMDGSREENAAAQLNTKCCGRAHLRMHVLSRTRISASGNAGEGSAADDGLTDDGAGAADDAGADDAGADDARADDAIADDAVAEALASVLDRVVRHSAGTCTFRLTCTRRHG